MKLQQRFTVIAAIYLCIGVGSRVQKNIYVDLDFIMRVCLSSNLIC